MMTDTSNEFAVARRGFHAGAAPNAVVTLRPIPQYLTHDQALRAAAWLAVIADPRGEEFQRVLDEVRNT